MVPCLDCHLCQSAQAFFRYGGTKRPVSSHDSSCNPGTSPLLSGQSPFSPSWGEVERLIGCMALDQPRTIRDRAILLLFALYGLRSSEVARLRLEDIDWGT